MGRKRKSKTISGVRVPVDFYSKVKLKAQLYGISIQEVFRNLEMGGTL